MKSKVLNCAAIVAALSVLVGGLFWQRRMHVPQEDASSSHPPIVKSIIRSFRLTESREDRFSKRLTFESGAQTLRLEIVSGVDPDSAVTLIEDGKMGIHALYASALSAYPENLSSHIATPERFRPIFNEKSLGGVPYRYFLLYATDRLGYGATDEGTARFKALLGWIYSIRLLELYKVEVFGPREAPSDALESFFFSLDAS